MPYFTDVWLLNADTLDIFVLISKQSAKYLQRYLVFRYEIADIHSMP